MPFIKRFQRSLESSCRPSNDRSSSHRLSDNLANSVNYVVAYSGGVDSHVLLHCCQQLDLSVRAVHVHHGLQSVADYWVKHCQQICEQLSIPLEVFYVDAKQQPGLSPEETARNVRYEVIHKNLNPGDFLLTAQHENDQAETLLLQLFRTASAAGLAAMPAYKKIAGAVHVRPLLNFSRDSIVEYARQNELHWIEDPSNQDTKISRNFIRSEVLPLLQGRWPELTTQLCTVAELQSNNLQVLEDMAAIDLAKLIRDDNDSYSYAYKVLSRLSISDLQDLSSARSLNVLRLWIMVTVNKQPSRNLLNELEVSLISSSQDAEAAIKFSQYTFRKFQGNIYLLESNLPAREVSTVDVKWSPLQPLNIADQKVQLSAEQFADNQSAKHSVKNSLPESLLSEILTVSYRKGGERFHPAGRKHSQSLKKLLQEANIPPWERKAIPLIYLKDELIAVADLWVAAAYAATVEQGGWSIKLSATS